MLIVKPVKQSVPQGQITTVINFSSWHFHGFVLLVGLLFLSDHKSESVGNSAFFSGISTFGYNGRGNKSET